MILTFRRHTESFFVQIKFIRKFLGKFQFLLNKTFKFNNYLTM